MEHEDYDDQKGGDRKLGGPQEEGDDGLADLLTLVFIKSCPDQASDYCSKVAKWAVEVDTWLKAARLKVNDCCDGELPKPSLTLPPNSCSDWQSAWDALHAFANGMRPYLAQLEGQIRLCTSKRICRRFPTPRLKALGANDDKHPKEACKNARRFFSQFEKWGDKIRDVLKASCPEKGPRPMGHLGRPPEPPF